MLGHRPLSAAEYLGIWRRRKGWAILCLVLGLGAGYALARALPARYTSTAGVEVARAAEMAGATPGAFPVSDVQLSVLEEQFLTRERLHELAERSGMYPPPGGGKVWSENSFAEMRKDTVLAPSVRGFTISFTAGDAGVAQRMCAGLSSLFTQEGHKDNPQEAAGGGQSPGTTTAGKYLDDQIAKAKQKLDALDARMAALKRRNGGEPSVDDDAETQNSLMGYNAQLDTVNAALRSALQERAILTESLQTSEPAKPQARPAAEPGNVQALEQELATEQAHLVTLEARYTPDYPDVVKLRTNIAQLEKKIDEAKVAAAVDAPRKPEAAPAAETPQAAQVRAQIRELDLRVQQKTAEQSGLQGEIRAARARLQHSASLENEYAQMRQERKTAQSNYDELFAKQSDLLKAAQRQAQGQRATFRLSEAANLPTQPSWPNPVFFSLGGAAGGLVVGLGVVLLGELRDKTLRTEGDIEYFLELPTLAVIPPAGEPGGRKSNGRSASRMGIRENGEKEESVLADV